MSTTFIILIICVVIYIIIMFMATHPKTTIPVAMAGDYDDYKKSLERDKQENFELTPDEVEAVRYALAKRRYQIENLLTSWDMEGVDKNKLEYKDYQNQMVRESPILQRIIEYQRKNKSKSK